MIGDLRIFIGHDVLLRGVERVFPRLLERSDSRVVAPDRLATLRVVRRVRLFDFLQRGTLRGSVSRSDPVGAFERHVLEHVREAGDACYFLRGSDVGDRRIREDGRFGTFINDERQSVVELLHGDPLLDRGEVLRP